MNKVFNLNNVLIMLLLIAIIAILNRRSKPSSHVCIDMTHQICDGQCECDGLACEMSVNRLPANSAYQIVLSRDYQVELIEDSILIFDGHRYIATLPIQWNNPTALDSVLMKDNE